MLEWFKCPDGKIFPARDCLVRCRMEERCLTLPTLLLMSSEREWTGTPSTTQLLNGTMMEFLKLTQPYAVDPDSRAFMIAGTKHHAGLDDSAKKLNLPSEIALSVDRDIFDLLEPDGDGYLLTDYKLWGSYRVAKALGIVQVGKQPDPSGEVYKTSGKWGKAGDPKMVPVFMRIETGADNWETELQLNHYRVMLLNWNIKVTKMRVQATVRDGGLAVAESRGITRNIYMIPIKSLDDKHVQKYFDDKELNLKAALAKGEWSEPCNSKETWDGVRCREYCEVAMYCPKGVLYRRDSAKG